MKLKKINLNLLKNLNENGWKSPDVLLKESFGIIKGGNDSIIINENTKQNILHLCIHSIQKTEKSFELSPRVLIVAKDKPTVLEIFDAMNIYAKDSSLRIFYTHDKTNLDEDKNLISLGVDILIGTPTKLNEMFSSAGFDVNQLKMLVYYELDQLLKLRHETILYRLSESIGKTQRVYFLTDINEKTELFIDKTTVEPYWFENEDLENEEE